MVGKTQSWKLKKYRSEWCAAYIIDSSPKKHLWNTNLQCRTDIQQKPAVCDHLLPTLWVKLGRNRLGEITGERQELGHLMIMLGFWLVWHGTCAREIARLPQLGMTIQHSSQEESFCWSKSRYPWLTTATQEENFLGICKLVQLVTQHTRSVTSPAQNPTIVFRDHKLLEVVLTQKLLFTSKELPQPSPCWRELKGWTVPALTPTPLAVLWLKARLQSC